jgi:type IV pilus assembly protein PilC
MDIVHRTTGNSVVRQSIKDLHDGLIDGQGLSKPMARSGVFPSLMVQMVMVGEHTGTLDSNLSRLADYYEDEVEKQIKSLVALLEPSITVALGLGVGFIAMSLIMPMYSIMGSFE